MQNTVLEKMKKIKTLFQESKEQALQFSCYAAIIYAFIVTILSRMRISHKIR